MGGGASSGSLLVAPFGGELLPGSARTSPLRRQWRRDSKDGCLPHSPVRVLGAPQNVEERLTMECVKMQQRLGELAWQSTVHL
mmetsp:Transcript_41411/g.106781  ORF Transcript_41411/g.106781 Transcript_41411/m.106781 type:complete len:83 (-) Transcript_41411:565-813(-)